MLRLFVSFILLVGSVSAAEWPHWRGPNRNGITSEPSGWAQKAWPLKRAKWTFQAGVGCTSPIVAQGCLYTMGHKSGKDFVYCLDAKSGKVLWTQSYRAPIYGRYSLGDKRFYAGPSSTPEYDRETGYLYTLSLDGDLRCWDTGKKGSSVWGVNLYDKYKTPQRPQVGRSGHRDYGFTSSPLLYRDSLLVEVGSRNGNLMAFDKRTGKRSWGSKAIDPPGHNGGPALMVVEGVPCAAVLHHNGLLVVRLDKGHEGETVATYPWRTEFANNIASPTVYRNTVLITSAYNFKKICKLEITLRGAKKIWESPYASKACSPVVYKDRVYWVWRTVHCLDFKTGKQLWGIRSSFGDPGSCIVTGDERLILYGKRGKLMLAETAVRSPRKGTVLSTREGLTRYDSWPHVILASGMLYTRDSKGAIQCFPLR